MSLQKNCLQSHSEQVMLYKLFCIIWLCIRRILLTQINIVSLPPTFAFLTFSIADMMPKTPRKNPTPRKLLPLSADDELQQNDDAYLKEMEFSTKESLPATVFEDSVLKLTAKSSSHSEFGRHADAPTNVESKDRVLVSSRHRSAKQASTSLSKEPEISVTTTTSVKFAGNCRKHSKRSQKKESNTRRTKVRAEGAEQTVQADKQYAAESSVELQCASVCDEHSSTNALRHYKNVHITDESVDQRKSSDSFETTDPLTTLSARTCYGVLISDNMHNKDIDKDNSTAAELHSDNRVMSASATCGTTDSTNTTNEAVDVCMPTPQKNQLRFLSEELLSLNQESVHITTHIHRRSGATPHWQKKHRQSLSTPRRFSILSSDNRLNSRSPRSTPRKTSGGQKTPMKVKFSFSTTPSKSQKKATKTPSSKKKSPRSCSVLKFPTPSKAHTKRKLYTDSPEHDARKPAKISRYVSFNKNFR